MEWNTLYDMQRQLDRFIEEENGLQQENLFDRKLLALLVEVGELANETRSFKFWSKKGPSERKILLEEYVDGIHFLLSLGIELDLILEPSEDGEAYADLNAAFFAVYEASAAFAAKRDEETYQRVWGAYLSIGTLLAFTSEEVMQAYVQKNEKNVIRQQTGY